MRYRKIYALLLTLMLTVGNASAQVHIKGSVFGGGNKADVKTTTTVNMGGGTVDKNVYGGGNLGDVGRIVKNTTDYNYQWTDDATTDPIVWNETGVCTVNITDGTVGGENKSTANHASGHVFGAGKGADDSFYCEKGMVYKTNVTIGKGTIYGNVYGGGEVGRVENDATVKVGLDTGSDVPDIKGNVFGAGAGVATHGYSALVRGNATVTVQSKAKVGESVYGGGEIASVGRFVVNPATSLPTEPLSGGTCTVTITGQAEITGDVFGACKGVEPDYEHNNGHVINTGESVGFTDEDNYLAFLKTLALTSNTDVAIAGSAEVNGSVFGGGQRGVALGYVEVDVTGGTVSHDVYGGGALADTNTSNWDSSTSTLSIKYYEAVGLTVGTSVVTGLYTRSGDAEPYTYTKITEANTTAASGTTYYRQTDTKVSLTGGKIIGDAYGGGLGDANTPAYVYGDVRVDLNGETTDLGNDAYGTIPISSSSKGCIVRRVFGCNNINGTPKGKVLVHVHSTQSGDPDATQIAKVAEGDKNKVLGSYDVLAVYGGGNEAAYDPVIKGTETEAAHAHTHVVIDGCDLTSIETVYGGGNAASTPSTKVEINGSYEINEVFGGGNGKDPLSDGSKNLGANVGYYTYENPDNATTEQKNAKRYGFGKAEVEIGGGIIHSVYGGSNQRGNVREVAIAMLEKVPEACFEVGEAYGGGKSAPMDGRAELMLGCIPGVGEVYGGARNAAVNNDVALTITNGTYNRIFGGNNEGGTINGTIAVNIEETGCTPIVIGQLFGGGNQAAYTTPTGEEGPTLNIKSFTSIGEIYGGGYSAQVTGDTHVNINEVKGVKASEAYAGNTITLDEHDVVIPAHAANKIGSIGNVYGGGYGANVEGNTYVNIGTQSTVEYVSGSDHDPKNVEGADITGDVFGGGYGASTTVTGTATVNIGEVLSTVDPETQAVTVTGYKDNHASFVANKGIYGGSALGTVENSQINLYAGTIACEVFGGGMGRLSSGQQGQDGYVEAQGATSKNTTVTLYDATVTGAIYGGCNINGTTTTAEVNMLGGTLGVNTAPQADILFAGGKGNSTTTTTATMYIGKTVSETLTGASTIYSNVYGGSALGAVGTSNVYLNQATSVSGAIFGGGMGNANTAATITSASNVYLNSLDITNSNIYGGCNVNGTAAETIVTLKGGKAKNVFGGGYGANTYVTGNVLVNVGEANQSTDGVEIHGDVYGGGALGHVNGTKNTTPGGALPITPIANATTTVNLNKGIIFGDAYGGGLGTSDAAAYVGGKVFVNLNGAALNISYYEDSNHSDVVKSGRVFGCNNLNGYPLDDVTVTVDKTVGLTTTGGTTTINTSKPTKGTNTFEVAAVYGGGNLANYSAIGKKTNVIVNGCDATSIRYVYGGGNAAAVPRTEVEINGAYELAYVFGGGNGKDDYTLDDGVHWQSNPGADVKGNVNTVLKGGCIIEAYGGSNEKGKIEGSVSINTGTGTGCDLSVNKIYGAGKNADIDGDLIVILGCMPGDENKTSEVYGGAENANIKGNVELTITSGSFGKVFGGNNQSGAIFGHIILNIEETGCRPIKIDELYLGGNQAAYSVYGYYQDGTIEGTDKPKYVARQSSSDGTAVTFGNNPHTIPPYDNPELNVVSFTSIGKVFGGGLGERAVIYGDPTVNINQIKGTPNNTASANLGVIGDVYGGGNQAIVEGNTTVNIVTEPTVDLVSINDNPATTDVIENRFSVLGANITRNIYGGGKLANVTGNTFVNICAKKSGSDYVAVAEGTSKVTIGGNVFGGGQGEAAESGEDAFTCARAMVGVNNAGLTDTSDGGTTVIIGNGTVNGTVYGGGEIGRVEKNTKVTIGLGDGVETGTPTSAPEIKGNVFGGGQGEKHHGYAGLVRGNPTVTIKGNAKVRKSVYGGGEIASVARYKLAEDETEATEHGVEVGMPYVLANANSGYCNVTVGGYAEIGPETGMKMYHSEITDGSDTPDDYGHVFGAGKGILPEVFTYVDHDHQPYRIDNTNNKEYYDNEDDYFAFIQTLALSTQTNTTIGDHAFVKGSVYGGSENGLVQFDTNVTINSGQIGAGEGVNRRYTDSEWASGSLAECAHWKYEAPYAPYDPNANATDDLDKYPAVGTQAAKSTEGGRRVASDGHTYYGNVFGGGSGSVPYFDTQKGISRYIMTAGQVKGNTTVTINGGHILTNVYGGCEATNVLGTATITMTDGTIGVPRTDAQIQDHPVTGYLFGAGKGDQRVFFNKDTNVENAVVSVTGGRIYGSVYGGGEDGHVLKNVTLTIDETNSQKPTIIGTKGTSYYDGHVFGGGRGFGGEALTAGNIGGTVTLNIQGGKMLGSVYGGGRLASVGYGLYLTTETGYGEMRPDNKDDKGNDVANFKRGYITVNINGGTIGNDETGDLYGGNVFGGSMGRLTKLDGSAYDAANHWSLLATAKKTTVNVTGGTIKRSVYGGGEMGTVTTDAIVTVSGGEIGTANKGGAEYGNVYGGGKGYVDPAGSNYITAGIIKGNTNVQITGTSESPVIYHNIYGGGAYGSVGEFEYNSTTGLPTDLKANTTGGKTEILITGGKIGTNGHENGMVFGSSRGDVGAPGEIHDKLAWVYDTHVTIGTSGSNTGPQINGSVYGGGENGHTFNNSLVEVHSGTIGIIDDPSYAYRGNVYGGGCGTDKYWADRTKETNKGDGDTYNPLAGIVYGNAKVTMDGGQVVHNVYGAGAMGSVGKTNSSGAIIQDGTTAITINGGIIGVDGTNGDGNVFGAARGDFASTQTHLAQVRSTTVNMSNGTVNGNVYGGGEAGDVGTYTNTFTETGSKNYVWDKISGNEIGACAVEITGGTVKGNVFGAGKGEANTFECEKAIARAASVIIKAGTVNKNVYGGGEVGRVDQDSKVTIGVKDQAKGDVAPDIKGSVFGAGAGKETHGYSALVRGNAEVIVQGNAKVGKSVYGGGEIAAVGRYGLDSSGMPTTLVSGGECKVTVKGYTDIGENVFGAGEGVVPAFVSGESKRMDNTGGWEIFTNRDKYLAFLQTLALATDTKLSIEGNAIVKGSVYGGSESGFVQRDTEVKIQGMTGADGSIIDGNIYGGGKGLDTFAEAGRVSGGVTIDVSGSTTRGSVFGGGELGIVVGAVTVDIKNGTIEKDVYGGGALADTNTGNATNATSTYTTTVNLLGGSVNNAYGGGLGDANTPAYVYGDVKVNLNGLETADYVDAIHNSLVTDIDNTAGTYYRATDGCVVTGYVFGCNNINGTPKGHAKVHVFKTKAKTGQAADGYDVKYVFGGGNAADYVPVDATQSTEVIIEGCDLTSIEEVYGGGYGAATPGTNVLIRGTKVINNLYGGGYGASTSTFNNPGANIGYRTDMSRYSSGEGKTVVQLMAGKVNNVYGGSNSKGDIFGGTFVTNLEKDNTPGCCGELVVQEIYGGGKEAPMEGGAEIVLGCMPEDWIGEIYAGARKADVGNDVSLTITSGKFGSVFGGNRDSGVIDGYVEVNIEECPTCGKPGIVIGELYGGGNEAAYTLPSSYGANYQSPRVNVRSFTSIGTIYGGGYGAHATVKGNPTVNINVGMVQGGGLDYDPSNDNKKPSGVTLYPHEKNKIGVIGNVFGGGNAAPVDGNTTVNVGTSEYEVLAGIIPGETKVYGYYVRTGTVGNYQYSEVTNVNAIAEENTVYCIQVFGADIRGNVYGGGNQASVTGNTNVVIGKKKVTE